jgi:hypothetical protein
MMALAAAPAPCGKRRPLSASDSPLLRASPAELFQL